VLNPPYYAAEFSAVSVNDTPHSPQRKTRISAWPLAAGAVRERCIERPQLGQAGRAVMALSKAGNETWIANMVTSWRA